MFDDKEIAATIDKLVVSMRGVINELSPDERKRVLTSIRAISTMSQTASKRPRAATIKKPTSVKGTYLRR
jgi:hypothetical protein